MPGGGDIFFIPPEFYGPIGLGQGLTQIGQTLEQKRARKKQEEQEDERIGIAKRAEDRQQRVANFTIASQALEQAGATQESKVRLFQDISALPPDVQTTQDPAELLKGLTSQGVQRLMEANGDLSKLPEYQRMLVQQAAFGSPFASEDQELEEGFATVRTQITQKQLDRMNEEDAAANKLLSTLAPDFSGQGVTGLQNYVTLRKLNLEDEATRANIRAAGARAGLMRAQTDQIIVQTQAMQNAGPEISDTGQSLARQIAPYVAGLVPADVVDAYAMDPNSVPEQYRTILDPVAERIMKATDATAMKAIREADSDVLAQYREDVNGLLSQARTLQLTNASEAQVNRVREAANLKILEMLSEIYPEEFVAEQYKDRSLFNWIGEDKVRFVIDPELHPLIKSALTQLGVGEGQATEGPSGGSEPPPDVSPSVGSAPGPNTDVEITDYSKLDQRIEQIVLTQYEGDAHAALTAMEEYQPVNRQDRLIIQTLRERLKQLLDEGKYPSSEAAARDSGSAGGASMKELTTVPPGGGG